MDAVADAEIGKAHDLGKGAHHDDIAPLADILQDVRCGPIVEELEIGLVKDNKDMIRNLLHEAVDGLLSHECSGGIVGIGQKEGLRLGSDRGKHGIKVGGKAGIGHLHRVGSEELGHELVDRKGMTGHHDLVTRTKEGMADKLDDLVGTVAKNDVFAGKAEPLRDRTAKLVAAPVWIEVGSLQGATHRLQSLGRRPERILIGSKLDDLLLAETKVAGQFLNRLARFVNC